MLERDDLAAGILLTRAVIQNAGFVWRLNELLETRNQYSPEQLRDNFERMLLPWAPVDDPLPLDSPRHSYAPYIHVGGADPRDHHARASRPTLRVITIAGTGDHLRPEWPITFTGMCKRMPGPAAAEMYTVPAKRGILRV
jgi:hypothetical protein